MNTPSAFLRALKYLIPLALLACGLTAARAQSTEVAGGTLSWSSSGHNDLWCGYENNYYNEWDFTSFSFLYGGTTYPIAGNTAFFVLDEGSIGCPPAGPRPFNFGLPSGIGEYSGCLVEFTAEIDGGGTAEVTTTGCSE
jgi:hypothetical protein